MSREALHLHFGGTNGLEAFAALLLCERPFEPSDDAVHLARLATELARDRSRGNRGTKPLPVPIDPDLVPFRALYALAREQAKNARPLADSVPMDESRPALAVRLLLSLRHRQRAAVGLRYLIGLPRDAVGLILGLPPRAVDGVLRAALGSMARGSRSKIDVRRNLRTAASLAWTPARETVPLPAEREARQPRRVVRLLLAPSPFGLDEPAPAFEGTSLAAAHVVTEPRAVYGPPMPDAPPRIPASGSRPRRPLVRSLAAAVAAILVLAMFAAWPRGARVAPVPLAVVPLAPHMTGVSVSRSRSPAGPVASTYVVRAGDTLWSIAARSLGDPFRWQQVWRSNAGRRMSDGSRFVDPDLIRPGWRLQLPRERGGG